MNSTRIWTFGGVVVIIAVLGLGWLLGVSPLLGQAAAADAERTTVESTNLLQQATLAAMRADHENLSVLQAELAGLQGSIPATEDLEEFAVGIESIAASHGLRVTSIVATEVPYAGAEAGASSGSGADGVTVPTGSLVSIAISIGLDGPADAVSAAVAEMQAGPRLFLVNNLSFAAASTPASSASVGGFVFLISARPLATGPDDIVGDPSASEHTSNYEVPDLDEALPEWLGGEGSAPSTVTGGTPTPTPTETPAP